MGLRRQGRELALQALYAVDLNPMEIRTFLRILWDNVPAASDARSFAERIIFGVAGKKDEIDALIGARAKNWTIQRMAKVDLNILRMATFELLHMPDVPRNVTINEAIEIARTYGTEDSPAFVNGILDEIAANVPGKERQQA